MTDIYIVRTQRNGSGSDKWFWDYGEAIRAFENSKDLHNLTSSEFFRLDVEELITEFITDTLDNGADNEPELLDSFFPNDVTWTELVFRPDGCFTFERLLSPDYWPYIVEPYSGELARGTQAWRVLDATTATPIAIIRPKEVGTGTAFTVVVNGYSQTQTFGDLKSAAIYAATEYNG